MMALGNKIKAIANSLAFFTLTFSAPQVGAQTTQVPQDWTNQVTTADVQSTGTQGGFQTTGKKNKKKAVTEPATFVLLTAGLGLAWLARRGK